MAKAGMYVGVLVQVQAVSCSSTAARNYFNAMIQHALTTSAYSEGGPLM